MSSNKSTYTSNKTGEQIEGSANIFNIRSDSSDESVRSYLPEGKYPIASNALQTIRVSTPLSKALVGLNKVVNNTTSADIINSSSNDSTWPTARAVYRFFTNNKITFNVQNIKVGVKYVSFVRPEFILVPAAGYRLPDNITVTNITDYHYDPTTGSLRCTLPLNDSPSTIEAIGGH